MAYNPVLTFLQEAEELIADIEQSALTLCSEDSPEETINRLFRDFHTIKGSGSMFGMETAAKFTHHIENLLDKVRTGKVPVSERLVEFILKATDHIKILLRSDQGGLAAETASSQLLIDAIAEFVNSAPCELSGPLQSLSKAIKTANVSEQTWLIRFHPHRSLLANGGNPVALLADLRSLGPCEITAHTSDIPPLDAIQPDQCYLWWTITLRTVADEDAIHDVFVFVEDGKLEIKRAESALPSVAAPQSAATPVPASPKTLITEATVRVPADRLDHLVALVGEFVMNHSCLAQAASHVGVSELANPIQVLERLVADLRDNVLGIRMLPIGTLFGRFRRVVHDLSLELGKEANLVTEGSETELDKSILDQLGEPLVHCLRNCLDHGIEPAADRLAKGKPPQATIRLSAIHTGSNVVIGIEDDGGGIDKEAVRAKAVEKHLVAADASLSDKDILNLILLPGFSTARRVTSVSGRGVGMDAVKRQIDALRGSLSLKSIDGKGTHVSITLPLTLAIIDGLLVQIGGDRLIVPMAAVTENVELNRAERALNNGRNVLPVRGKLIPYIDLRQIFRLGGCPPAVEKVVIVQHGDDRVGLVVDRVIGANQTVIQALGKFYKKVEVVSGATIMGDGRVALILDVAAIVRYADRECQRESAGEWINAKPIVAR